MWGNFLVAEETMINKEWKIKQIKKQKGGLLKDHK